MYFKNSKIVINFHCVNPAWYGKCCHIHLIWTTVFPAILFQETRAAAYGESGDVKNDEEEHPNDDQDDDADPGEDQGGGDGGDHDDDEKGAGGDKEPSDDSSDEGPPEEFMQPKPKSMPKQPAAPFLSPEGAASGSERPPAPPDHPPGVPPQPRHGPPSDHHFRRMSAGFWIDKDRPHMRTSGDYPHVTDPILCLELCLRKALLFTFKITIALALILWHFNVQTYPFI